MKERPLIDLGMTGYDELFMNDAERREASLPKIYNIPLSEIGVRTGRPRDCSGRDQGTDER